ncbi:hypothetical protein D3C75_811660 [compost metagenome]
MPNNAPPCWPSSIPCKGAPHAAPCPSLPGPAGHSCRLLAERTAQAKEGTLRRGQCRADRWRAASGLHPLDRQRPPTGRQRPRPLRRRTGPGQRAPDLPHRPLGLGRAAAAGRRPAERGQPGLAGAVLAGQEEPGGASGQHLAEQQAAAQAGRPGAGQRGGAGSDGLRIPAVRSGYRPRRPRTETPLLPAAAGHRQPPAGALGPRAGGLAG